MNRMTGWYPPVVHRGVVRSYQVAERFLGPVTRSSPSRVPWATSSSAGCNGKSNDGLMQNYLWFDATDPQLLKLQHVTTDPPLLKLGLHLSVSRCIEVVEMMR